MKLITKRIFGAITALAILPLSAGVEAPRSVHSMAELEEAKAEALEKEKPLIFVYSSSTTT